jgi:hypothetical protein
MTKAQLIAALVSQVRQLVKAGVQVTAFEATGENPHPIAFLTISSPGGPRTVSLDTGPLVLAGLQAALQHAVRMVLRPWEEAHRNGFDTTGLCVSGEPAEDWPHG